MTIPLVSVILPVYNQERYIEQTINSILSQTYSDFELIIVDDGSKDKSADIIKKLEQTDGRIKAYFFNNSGRANATNKAVSLAKGKYCALLDADDLMMPDRLEKQIDLLEKQPIIEAVSAHCIYVDGNGLSRGVQSYNGLKSIQDCKDAIADKKIVHCAITALTILKDVYISVGGLDAKYWPCDDLEIANRLLDKKHILVIMQIPLMKYRVHGNSESTKNQWEMFERGAYTNYNIMQRRLGKIEITFEEYKAISDSRPWRQKLKKAMIGYAKIYHKKAGFSLHSKNYFLFLYYIGIAVIMDNNYVRASLKKRLAK